MKVDRAARWLLVLLAASIATACGGQQRRVLRPFRLVAPKRELAQPVWLASFASDELWGRLSPDGRRLLYAADPKGSLDIWVKDLTTGLPQRITRHVAVDTEPGWSPDGRKIVFVSMRADAKGDIYLWDDGELERLTDRSTADATPAFTPEGDAIYFAGGPEGQSRIFRLTIDGGGRQAITGWGARHPAPSPDGRYLAYTQFDGQGRGRIAVRRLSDGRTRLLTTPHYHAGFPAFSADGRYLLFSRFYRGAPRRALDPDTPASLWRVAVDQAFNAADAGAAQALADQLTSDRYTTLFVQAHGQGLVLTRTRAGSLDIGLLPERGALPALDPARFVALAEEQDDPWDELLCLRQAWRRDRGQRGGEARYRASVVLRRLGEFAKARALLDRLAKQPAPLSEIVALARIDRALLPLEQQALRHRQQGGPAPDPAGARAAIAALPALDAAPSHRVAAHRLLREGDALRLSGQTAAAVARYESVLSDHPGQRRTGVLAKLHLGEIFGRVRTPDLLAEYYLTLLADFPDQAVQLRAAVNAVLDLYRELPHAQQVEKLRRLIDAHPDKPLFAARAQRRIALLYEKSGQPVLAIQALHAVTSRYRAQLKQATAAAFALGRIALAHSKKLRAAGRLGEALSFYRRAREAFQWVVKAHEPGHANWQRARGQYLRLSLLEAGQLERDGERALAEKRYRELLVFDDEVVQAHRRLIVLALADKQAEREKTLDTLVSRYQARRAKDSADFIAHYGLGYLATLRADLDADALDDAEDHIRRAVELRPQSPFGHMTLGWIYDMRERLLGQTGKGWLEEAIKHYDQAHALNDGEIDRQTEADLLVNLCTVFAALGNGWPQAFDFCGARQRLRLPFLSPRRAAHFHLTYGRAAYATGQYDVAGDQLEQALELARRLKDEGLETEVLARTALGAHLAGDYQRSTQLLREVITRFRRQGREQRLAGLTRSIAYNHLLAGDLAAASAALDEAQALLEQHGAPAVASFVPIGPVKVGRTTAPFGLDAIDERHAILALRQRIADARRDWPAVRDRLAQRLKNRLAALEQRDHAERRHELLQIYNQQALAAARLEPLAQALARLKKGLALAEELQSPEGAFEPDDQLFAVQVGLALNLAELLLSATLDGDQPAELEQAHRLLSRLEKQRAQWVAENEKPLLGQRLRFALWADIAALSLHRGLRPAEDKAAAGKPKTPGAEQALQRLVARGRPLVEAVNLLRRIVRATAPAAPETPDTARPSFGPALVQGTLAQLYRPLPPVERLRWHVRAGLHLAHAATVLTPPTELADHPSTALLGRLAQLCVAQDLGALKFVVAAELALRRQSMQAMQAAVDAFLARSPLRLGQSYQRGAAGLRHAIFSRAIRLALAQQKPGVALGFAEQWERRASVDDLVALSPAGSGLVAAPMEKLLREARAYREVYAAQPLAEDEEAFARWQGGINKADRAVRQALVALGNKSPEAAGLLSVSGFSLDELVAALQPGEVLLSAVIDGGQVLLVALRQGSEPATRLVPQPLASLRRKNGATLLAPHVAQLTRDAQRVYLDLGRVDPALDPRALLGEPPAVLLAGSWELLDARAARTFPLADPLLVDAKPGSRTPAPLGALDAKALESGPLQRRLERAGLLVWRGALRFEGEPAGPRLPLPGGADGPLRLAQALGLPLRARVVVLGQAQHTAGLRRREEVALARLLHAARVSSFIVLDEPARAAAIGAGLVRQLGEQSLSAFAAHHRLRLYGDGGAGPAATAKLARQQIDDGLAAGKQALAKRQLSRAVEQLQGALGAMDLLGEQQQRDKALGALAQAYTLQEDYARAIPYQRELLALLQRRVDQAREGGGRALLVAQAARVKALTAMGWIQLRSKHYDEALEANAEAIAIYRAVKRPLLAGPAYAQRTIIASQKGDVDEALDAAKHRLEIARTRLSQVEKKAKGVPTTTMDLRLAPSQREVADAAVSVARLQRVRFSDYRGAMASARLALAQLRWADPAQLAGLRDEFIALNKRLKQAAGQAKDKLTRQLTLLKKRGQQLRSALIARVEAVLEIARIHGARGDYGGAVRQAETAQQLAQRGGLSQREAAQLEVVNNLYYMGAYQRALSRAEQGLEQTKKSKLRQIQFFNVKGTVLAALGRYDDALVALRQALAIARAIDNPAEVASSHNNIGDALRRAGRLDQARRSFSKALSIDRQREDQLAISFDFANIGVAEALMGRVGQARRDLEQAITLSQEIGAPLNELKARVWLGRLDLEQKKAKQARDQFERGLALARKLGLRNWLWRFQLWSARAARRLGDAKGARRTLEAALQIVEQRPPRLRQAVNAKRVEAEPEDVFDELLDLLATSGEAERAFDLSERFRARSFVDLISKSSAELPLAEGAEDLRQIAELQVALEAARSARLRARGNSPAARQAGEEIAELEGQLQQARARLAGFGQALPSLLGVDAHGLQQLRPHLEAQRDTLLVSYYPGRRRLLVWVLDGAQLTMQTVDVTREALAREVVRFRRKLTHFDDIDQGARRLHGWLVEAVTPLKQARAKRLVLIPGGPLHLLPFAALGDGNQPLLERFTLSFLPSVNALRFQPPTREQDRPGRRLALAGAPGPAPLPFIRREVEAFGRSFDAAQVLSGEAATRDRFFQLAPKASLIHVAAHASYDPDAPLQTGFALADGPLTLKEVFGLRLGPALVVLSACNTGLGPLSGADGILGLHRAFLTAGARQVISSLWRVSDLGTALLMKHFFRGLAAGAPPALALQQAQQRVRQRFPHPAFWAGFRLDGAP